MLARMHRRAVAFLLSDFQAPDFSKPLSVAARRHDLVAIPIIDPRELELPNIGRVVLEDAETGERLVINTSDRRSRVRFAEHMAALQDDLPAMFARYGVDTISLHTDVDYVPALRRFFRNRERRLALG